MTGDDYAEPAAFTTTVYCLTCGPVIREHLPNTRHITYHRVQERDHPNGDATMPEEDVPVQ